MTDIKVGDVVFVEGASALLGDVTHVEDDDVTVVWREVETTELADDLVVTVERVQSPAEKLIEDVLGEPVEMTGVTESSEVLGFLEHAFKYRSIQNLKRADRGRKLIESHPDFGKMTDDGGQELLTAASDTIADILHGLNAAGVIPPDVSIHDFLGRAERSFAGDFEDEHDPEAGEPRG